jgi:hypothetical protein
MKTDHFLKAGVLASIVATAFVLSWEGYLRSSGFAVTYNDDKALWALHRPNASLPMDEATVFIGSSRIKFDLDIPTWEKLTGEKVVQLSLVGTSPRLLLQDLAGDESFSGKLIVDITEPLFFSQNPFFHQSAREAIAYYKKQTPTEKISNQINLALESGFVFLEERRFSLNTLLNDLAIPNRPGVFSLPPFPKGFEWTTIDRQTYMSEMFLSDTNDIKRQTEIWASLISGDPTPPLDGEALEEVMSEIQTAVEKIKDRGGKVIFVRTPSSGLMGEGEKMAFPREKYWDKILIKTEAPGIHFSDYPETAGLICPEWSHLSPAQAVHYTHHLVDRLGEKGWFSQPAT